MQKVLEENGLNLVVQKLNKFQGSLEEAYKTAKEAKMMAEKTEKELKQVKEELELLKEERKVEKEKSLRMEYKQKRINLILQGIRDTTPKESAIDLIQSIQAAVKDWLGLEVIQFAQVRRVGSTQAKKLAPLGQCLLPFKT